jgi:hypothetical protein
MIHTVALKKIVNLYNPYEVIPEGLDKPITLEEVENSLKKGLYLEEPSASWTRAKHIKRIAYLVIHPDTRPLSINIGNPEKNDTPDNILEDGFHLLAAAIYRKDTNILANLKGSEKALSSLFNIEHESIENNFFSWDVNAHNLKPTWASKEFVMKQILADDENVIKLADSSLWTLDFLEEIAATYMAGDFISNIKKNEPTVLFQENFIKVFSKNTEIFQDLWSSYFQYLFEKDEYKVSAISSFPGKAQVKKIVNKEVFSNKENSLKLIENDFSYYEYLSKELKLDTQVIDLIYKKNSGQPSYNQVNFGNMVPKEYFNDFKNNIKFMNTFYHGENQDYYELATKNWIGDRDKCLTMFKEFDDKSHNVFEKFKIYKAIDVSLKKDKDFNIQIVSVNPKFYEQMSEQLKTDPDIIEAACKSPKAINAGLFTKIPYQAFPFIKNEDIIKGLIYENPSLIEKDSWPKEWNMKKDYLISLGEKISRVEIKKVTGYKEFLKDENLVLELIENSNRFYYNLSTKDKTKPEYILKYIQFHEDKHKQDKRHLEHISHEVWLDKNFCINAFKADKDTIKFIPPHFFNQKDFILNFFQEVTPNNNSFVKNNLPKKINHFLTVFDVNDNYKDFFQKFFLSQSLEQKLDTKEKSTKIPKI